MGMFDRFLKTKAKVGNTNVLPDQDSHSVDVDAKPSTTQNVQVTVAKPAPLKKSRPCRIVVEVCSWGDSWQWFLYTHNNIMIAESCEYSRRDSAIRAAKALKRRVESAVYVEVENEN